MCIVSGYYQFNIYNMSTFCSNVTPIIILLIKIRICQEKNTHPGLGPTVKCHTFYLNHLQTYFYMLNWSSKNREVLDRWPCKTKTKIKE